MDISTSVSALNQVNDSAVKRAESKDPLEPDIQNRATVNINDYTNKPSLTSEQLTEVVKELNGQLESLSKPSLMFAVDEVTQSSIVKLVDRETNELVKQFPSEDALKMMQNIQEYLEREENLMVGSRESLTGRLFNEII